MEGPHFKHECFHRQGVIAHTPKPRIFEDNLFTFQQLGMCGEEELIPVLSSFWSHILTNTSWSLSMQLSWGLENQDWTNDMAPALTEGTHGVQG